MLRVGLLISVFSTELKFLLPRVSTHGVSLWKLSAKSMEPILIYTSIKKRDVSLSRRNDSFKLAVFVYDSFKVPHSGRGDSTSAAWILEEWGELIASNLVKIQCWLCFYTIAIHSRDRAAWASCMGCFFIGREMNWRRHGIFYPSLYLFTLSTLLNKYIR